MNLHATHPDSYDPACLVCTNEERWGVTPGRNDALGTDWWTSRPSPAFTAPNPDPLRPPGTDEPWADDDDDDDRVVWIGAVLLLVALLVGVVIGVVIGRLSNG